MKSTIFILTLCTLPFLTRAQNRQSTMEKMEARKITWISNKLDLSSDEAKIFWPIYNDYARELGKLRKERASKMISFRKIKEIDELNDQQIEELILQDFNFRQKTLNLEKKYYNRLKANLPLKIIGKFYRAQEAYKKELLQQYKATAQNGN